MDFIIQVDGKVVPIEVKGGNTKANSLIKIMEKKEIYLAYKIIDGNIGIGDSNIITIPHYMAMFI